MDDISLDISKLSRFLSEKRSAMLIDSNVTIEAHLPKCGLETRCSCFYGRESVKAEVQCTTRTTHTSVT